MIAEDAVQHQNHQPCTHVTASPGLETEFLKSRSSVREMDSVLRGTMEVPPPFLGAGF